MVLKELIGGQSILLVSWKQTMGEYSFSLFTLTFLNCCNEFIKLDEYTYAITLSSVVRLVRFWYMYVT